MQSYESDATEAANSTWLLSVNQAATRLGVSASYLNKLRVVGGGPPFIKIGARVVYDPSDLANWVISQRRSSTSELQPKLSTGK